MRALDNIRTSISRRWLSLGGWVLFTSILFARPLIRLVQLSLSNDDASHLILIPFLTAGLFYLERRSIFRTPSFEVGLSFLLVSLGFGLVVGTRLPGHALTPDLQLTSSISALVLFWTAGFSFFFGGAAVKAAYFPLLFLLFTVPPPNFLFSGSSICLRAGSADITGALFDLLGVPALREGLRLSPCPGKHRNSKGMQRYTVKHCAFRPGIACSAFRPTSFLEETVLLGLRTSHYDLEEWNPHRNSDGAGNLCGPGLSSRKTSP